MLLQSIRPNVVQAIRADARTPVTKSELTRADFAARALAQSFNPSQIAEPVSMPSTPSSAQEPASRAGAEPTKQR